ncbi:diguanylate cyclase [Roseomonas sp. 18066]|uniref:GGDEF domain-containing protein n=1 Tax=Roseomonas sp. 18066 TaxID=2681412 RepID=UPI001359984D|nr:GGDEF domain-containing protein [Roseomonas sp. 18066]
MLLTELPDLSTLRLCSVLLTVAFSAVFLALWIGRREDRYLLHWSASAVAYGVVLAGLEALGDNAAPATEPALAPVCLLLTAMIASNMLLVSGLRLSDGRAPWRGWMLPVLLFGVTAWAAELLAPALGSSLPPLSARRIGGSLGLMASVVVIGLLLMRGPQAGRGGAPAGAGRVIAGCAMLGYVPGYLIAMAMDARALEATNFAALVPMLSDQLLLPVLYLGLLAMPGERARHELREAALRDPLTGAWNRAGLTARQGGFLARGGTLILLDIDHFKAVNDHHGHAAGDAVLAGFAPRMAALANELAGELFRLGGDEFLVVLPGADETAATALARRMRDAAAQPAAGQPPYTISLGLAAVAPGEAELEGAMARADALLYRAKALGRDQVVA